MQIVQIWIAAYNQHFLSFETCRTEAIVCMFECNNNKAEAARLFAEKFAQELEAEGAAPPSTKFFREITEKMKKHGTVENLVSLDSGMGGRGA